jgi:hypothetical protein
MDGRQKHATAGCYGALAKLTGAGCEGAGRGGVVPANWSRLSLFVPRWRAMPPNMRHSALAGVPCFKAICANEELMSHAARRVRGRSATARGQSQGTIPWCSGPQQSSHHHRI